MHASPLLQKEKTTSLNFSWAEQENPSLFLQREKNFWKFFFFPALICTLYIFLHFKKIRSKFHVNCNHHQSACVGGSRVASNRLEKLDIGPNGAGWDTPTLIQESFPFIYRLLGLGTWTLAGVAGVWRNRINKSESAESLLCQVTGRVASCCLKYGIVPYSTMKRCILFWIETPWVCPAYITCLEPKFMSDGNSCPFA